MNRTWRCVAVIAWVAAMMGCVAMPAGAEERDFTQAAPEDLAWWRDARFGLFVHWGPVSLRGTEIGWSRGGERRGTGGTGSIPVEVYDNLYKEFNPIEFNAEEWVSIAKAAGMKYLVFTSRHHDGFSMFDSKLTDYKITNSPFKRDVVAELADACHANGLGFGLYYSPPDWHHPDYRTENHAKFIEFLHGQLRELCTNYGQLDIVWFDGLGGTSEDWDSPNLIKMIRALQPHTIINNRAGLPCDFDTPEQTIGHFQNHRPWESCITICQQWAWKPDDRLKTIEECVDTLVRCAGGDGNLLLNVGPMPTGAIEPRQVERLKEIGAWLETHGESIYGTRGGPFQPGPWGASTYRGNRVYVHVLEWPSGSFALPPLPKRVVAARHLGGADIRIEQTDKQITLNVPKADLEPIDTVIVFELDGPAADIEPVKWPSGSLAEGKPAEASNTYQNMAQYGPQVALDDDEATRWATDAGTHQAWLEVDLGETTRLGRAFISEAFDRVRKFELQREDGPGWKAFYEGKKIGEACALRFDPVETRRVRLHILEATEGPTIWEFRLFAPED
ncbi:MAG TPA: alpha-L-fucosidase [Candidatus Hydrogenedentes bacterium]|nr:alpha-L-fucosidase [Candidatus Hydrogenedentota bacterium]HPG68660.1 alpha-L-fucosidase [Candidatus Hydrogenedentota bacterium]